MAYPAGAATAARSARNSPAKTPAYATVPTTSTKGTTLGVLPPQVSPAPGTKDLPLKPSHRTSRTTHFTLDDAEDPLALLTAVETRLTDQQRTCTHASAYYYQTSQKDKALDFHRRKKRLAQDAATVAGRLAALAQGTSGPLPELNFVLRPVAYDIEEAHLDLTAGELELQIIQLSGLDHLGPPAGGGTRWNPYCTWDLNLPAEAGSTTALSATLRATAGSILGRPTGAGGVPTTDSKGTTASVKRDEATGDYPVQAAARVLIARNRALQRWAERRRLDLNLYHHKGVLWGSTWLGRTQIPLARLLTRCEVRETATLVDKLRRPLADGQVTVEVVVRLRTPLALARPVVTRQEAWIELGEVEPPPNRDSAVAPQPTLPTTPVEMPPVMDPAPVTADAAPEPLDIAERHAAGESELVPPAPSDTTAQQQTVPGASGCEASQTLSVPAEPTKPLGATAAEGTEGSRRLETGSPVESTPLTPPLLTTTNHGPPSLATPLSRPSPVAQTKTVTSLALAELLRVETIVSNMALEFESNLVNNILAALAVATLDTTSAAHATTIPAVIAALSPQFRHAGQALLQSLRQAADGETLGQESADQLQIRLTELQTKTQLLETQVAVGTLTLADYVRAVHASIVSHKQWAMQLKKEGDLSAARWALQRLKIMTEEVREVEEALGPM
ncbi:hypothetical protein IWQ60_009271 [Tieghemiomyces parasiticus]|uniref:Uncharacterized protein n=1 Tax=Tieghemiomyces parasiticus TaxID=78921 RepID=A0A9W7ZPP5_9FUNG|nr:hypothetical protein IWQ60_009271 [Tieghemiomyces parasiticus]